jgi:hypothetical protein
MPLPLSIKEDAMSISKTGLINKALTLVGANPITNIDDDTNNARVANRVYEISLKSILSECKWNFATTRKLLSSVDTDLAWYDSGETYIYQKPADCIRIFGTNDDGATWREEGDYIISDTTGLGIRYVYYLDEPNKYPSSFAEAFIDKLCSDICYMIVNSAQLAGTFFEKYQKVSLPKAMAENAQIGKQQYLKDDAWELAKYGNGTTDA